MPDKYFVKNIGVVDASGTELVDFLNRMSTNDFQKFKENEFRKTILTSDKGRIIDVITLLNSANRKIILTTAGFEQKVISHLGKYIIMDDVVLENSKDAYIHFFISGENSFQKIQSIYKIENDVIEKNLFFETANGEIIFKENINIESVNIICKKENSDKIKILLNDFDEMSFEEYEFFRISSGIAEGENELNEKINPMECGLEDLISFKKGCYIGQEVIARLDSQGKRPKQMVRINSDSKLLKDEKIFDNDEKEVGFVSSSVKFGEKYFALGFIRSLNLDYNKSYFVSDNENKHLINISKINKYEDAKN